MTTLPSQRRVTVPFSANMDWMRSLFRAMTQPPPNGMPHVDHHPANFRALTLFYRHGFLTSKCEQTLLEATLAGNGKPTLTDVEAHFRRRDNSGFLAAASVCTEKPIRFRDKHVRLRTANVFSRNFLPPVAAKVPERMQSLWSCLRQFEKTSPENDAIATAQVAYAAFFVLLTLHPFADGNGRTARMFYAATLCSHGADCPALVLALPLTFIDGGRRFHQAAQLARGGLFNELRANFLDSVKLANVIFSRDINTLAMSIDEQNLSAAQRTFESVHSTLRELTSLHLPR